MAPSVKGCSQTGTGIAPDLAGYVFLDSRYAGAMPIVEVTYSAGIGRSTLRQLAEVLPHAVSVAVECAEEPYDHALEPGDVEVRFREHGPVDSTGLDAVVEVRSKWFESRAANRQRRCDLLHKMVTEATQIDRLGVYLSLPVAAWAQSD